MTSLRRSPLSAASDACEEPNDPWMHREEPASGMSYAFLAQFVVKVLLAALGLAALLAVLSPFLILLVFAGGVGGGPALASGAFWKVSKTGGLWVGPPGFRRRL